MIVDLDSGLYSTTGDNAKIIVKELPKGSWGKDNCLCFSIQVEHDPKPKGAYNNPAWSFSARIDLGGIGHYLPLGNKYVEIAKGEGTRKSIDV